MRTTIYFIFAALFVLGSMATISYKKSMNKPDDKPLTFKKGKDYKKEWAKIDSLENDGLPKSALEIVEKIYVESKKENNHEQFVKALIYKMKFRNGTEDDAFETLIGDLQTEIKTAKFPDNALMHSMLGDMYWMYYEYNRWKFYNRSATTNFASDDIKTWDLNTLADRIINEYNLSLVNIDSLKRTPINVYDEVITKGSKLKTLRPTLYEFLAFRAIDFYSNRELGITRPADKFELREPYYFADAQEFASTKIETTDTMSVYFYAIKVYQDLIKFRLEKPNDDALIDADLSRLSFAYKNSVNELKDSLYLNALVKLDKKFESVPYRSEILSDLAGYYNTLAQKYNPDDEATLKYKLYNKKAVEICNKVTEKYPNTNADSYCKDLKERILAPGLSFQTEEAVAPDDKFAIKISYKNLSKAYIRIGSIDKNKYFKLKEQYYNNEELYDKLLKETEKVYEGNKAFPADEDYNTHSVEEILNGLPIGYYVIIVSDNADYAYKEKSVAFDYMVSTSISFVQRNRDEGSYEFVTLDRKTGAPLAGVTAEAWYNKYNYTLRKYNWVSGGKYTTDENGKVIIPAKKDNEYYNYYVEFSKGKDNLLSNNSYYSYRYNNAPEKRYVTYFFTDRAIYRPGQTIYFKGIVLEEFGEDKKIAPGHADNIILYDVNYQKVADLTLTTNEFGTYSGEFVIPMGLMNGQMQIYTSNGSKYISVEEYKRPKFEVTVLPLNGDYLLNQKVEVKGSAKTYAGTALTDANVTYRIVRQPYWRGWWYSYYYGGYSSTEITSGKAVTDDNGEYKIEFQALPDLSMKSNPFLSFNYTIYIDVTDLNGETHSTQKSITVGSVALDIDISLPEAIEKNSDKKYYLTTQNLNGEYIPAEGTITISKIKNPAQLFRSRPWTQPDKRWYTQDEWYKQYPGIPYGKENEEENLGKEKQVAQIKFNTTKEKETALTGIKGWEEGSYIAELESTDKFGNKITNKRYFTVFSEKETKMPVNEYFWFYSEGKPKYEPGETAIFIIGSSAENVKVLTEIEQKSKIILSSWTELSNGKTKIEIPVKEDYRGNVAIHFTFVKDNRLYKRDELIYVPYTNKEIDIQFETFRNKLYPGEKEEWKLILKGKKGDKVAAEMMATLYDASLDAFVKNYWYFNVWQTYYAQLSFQSDAFNTSSSVYLGKVPNYYYYNYETYDQLNWFGFSYYGYYGNYRYKSKEGGRKSAMPMSMATDQSAMAGESEVMEEKTVSDNRDYDAAPTVAGMVADKNTEAQTKADSFTSTIDGVIATGKDARTEEKVQIRSNFNETAFFYPQLKTNENGEVVISFTVPESLTRWKMMGMAHTKDLMTGYVENELVTQKDLMVMPNAPRFFRENDKLEFPVKINNVSDKELSGTATLEFFDAITMKPVANIFESKTDATAKEFKVGSGKNVLLTWKLKIPEGVQAVTYRVVAKAGKFSDGEENALPVLTNRMLVTESLPLPIRGKQTKEYSLDKLVNSGSSTTMRNQKLTLEFTSNPAWYAVQALPYLIEYPYECAEQTFSRFYANSIASHIANSNPKIKRVFDAWKNTPGSAALLSNLEKNQELKELLLQETPWVLNSQDESQRKRNVGLLFDLNKMSMELESAIKKLQKMQVSNGGWPWFEGMPESRYITQHIVCGMGKLDKLGVTDIRNNSKVWKMVTDAISYLDDRMDEDYRWLKKHYTEEEMKKDMLSELEIHYLYARSFFKDVEVPKRNKEAFDYYYGQAQQYWLNKSKYLQGMIALGLFRYGDTKIPPAIVKSLKEFSQTSDEMGMYWKENTPGYYWYEAPIEFQALMVELFDEVAKDQPSVNDLKVWLLKQKQTQDWKTTKATVEAVYALLMRGTQWLDDDELVKIVVGNTEIDPKKMDDVKVEAGTGYFKTSWPGSEIKPEMGKVKLTKTTEGVSWGALYWQYFEQLDKITPHETPLKLNKKLFVEKLTASGKVIEPLAEGATLKVGDKVIVRIELRVDRTMEYVHMKDMRASCMEPVNVMSSYKYQDGLGYYESTKDAATNFFFSYLPKGTYVFEYPLLVTLKGDFSNGITTIQCMYAPEFTSHSEGIRVKVE